MKVRFIVNPRSGRNRRRPWLGEAIRRFIADSGFEGDVVHTDGPQHATVLAQAAADAGCGVVVAVGGDGTVNEVAQGVVGTPTTLAVIPCGSGNGLARHLGVPRSFAAALDLLRTGGRVAAIDTGLVNGRHFFNAMGFGLDAEVSSRFNRLARRGLPAYLRTGLAAVRGRRAQRCILVGGGQRLDGPVLLVAIANSDQYGNNARIAPGACVDDGLLDLVALAPVTAAQLALLVPRLFFGTIDRSRHVTRLRAGAFAIERAAPGLIHTDGETAMAGSRLDVRVNPAALRVLVPAGSRVRLVSAADSALAICRS